MAATGRSMRGQGLGSKSLEDPSTVELAARQNVGFHCPNGHKFTITFAEEADVPTWWECPRCGETARRADGVEPVIKEEKPTRTHWDMLRERRTIPELEELLAERLQEIRNQD